VVTTPAARQAIEGLLAAGHYNSRADALDPEGAGVLAYVLRLYARLGHAPAIHDIVDAAALPESSVKEHLVRLRDRDPVVLDPQLAAIVGAFPFTDAATGHSVTFAGTGRTLATMCAIDALGAGAMCRDDTIVRSACRTCGGPIEARTDCHGTILMQAVPADAVVWVGLRRSGGCAADTICREMLFFCSDAHLARWRAERGGRVRSLCAVLSYTAAERGRPLVRS
jgi:hypothetical protein